MTLTAVPGIRVGHGEVPGGRSGCTVILGPFRGAVEIRGFATGSRELDLLSPAHLAEEVHALLLTGGSAFGLAAAEGVMAWLAEAGVGFDTGVAPVPLVPGAVIFDLAPGVPRPGPAEGRRACGAASRDPVPEGPVGAGAGARVGKVLGPGGSSPGGVGSRAGEWGPYTVGALAVVNAFGDVVGAGGEILSGVRGAGGELLGADAVVRGRGAPDRFRGAAREPRSGESTTLAVVATDAPLSRAELGRLARMAGTALPRAISPVGTPFDGDLVFALSTAPQVVPLSPGELLGLGVMARDCLEEAIRGSVLPEAGAESSLPRR